MNYAKNLPRDTGGAAMTDWPAPAKSQARFYRDNAVTSSIQTLTDNTTQIEVGTNGTSGAFIRWIPATETAVAPAGSVLSNNYDHFVPPNTVRQFVVPKEISGTSSIVGANIQNGLYKRVAIGIVNVNAPASILTTEY
jgi:hypothetical protein